LLPIIVHRCHRRCCRCRRATTTATATTVVKLTVIHCQRKRQQQHHHQRTNGNTNMKTFTSPVNLDLFNLSTVFEVCDVGQGNLAISKLLALKYFGPFLQSTYYWMSRSTFLGGGVNYREEFKTKNWREQVPATSIHSILNPFKLLA
jgi:hypothetical protein